MERYKKYCISGSAFPAYAYGQKWYAQGGVYTITPSGLMTEVKRFEPKEIFTSKDDAEAYGLKLAKGWVDYEEETLLWFHFWKEGFGDPV